MGELPSNVLALRWAPQVRILAEANAAIVHGGNASLNECIVFGVPMLVCSTGHLDQNGVASRVDVAGIGIARSGRAIESSTIEADLRRLIDEPEFAERIGRLRDLAARSDRGRSGRRRARIDRRHVVAT